MLRRFFNAMALSHDDVTFCATISRDKNPLQGESLYDAVEAQLITKFYSGFGTGFIVCVLVLGVFLLFKR